MQHARREQANVWSAFENSRVTHRATSRRPKMNIKSCGEPIKGGTSATHAIPLHIDDATAS
eukprot:scaffold3014_cov111-Skeletonema_dohrnii-CCMP3373.AAC.11